MISIEIIKPKKLSFSLPCSVKSLSMAIDQAHGSSRKVDAELFNTTIRPAFRDYVPMPIFKLQLMIHGKMGVSVRQVFADVQKWCGFSAPSRSKFVERQKTEVEIYLHQTKNDEPRIFDAKSDRKILIVSGSVEALRMTSQYSPFGHDFAELEMSVVDYAGTSEYAMSTHSTSPHPSKI